MAAQRVEVEAEAEAASARVRVLFVGAGEREEVSVALRRVEVVRPERVELGPREEGLEVMVLDGAEVVETEEEAPEEVGAEE